MKIKKKPHRWLNNRQIKEVGMKKSKGLGAIAGICMVMAFIFGTGNCQAGTAQDFVGKLQGQWEYTASAAAGGRRGQTCRWDTTMEVTEVGSKVMVAYSEGESPENLICKATYPPVEATLSDGVLSFPFTNPRTGSNFIIKIEKLPDGSFKATGRISGAGAWSTQAILHRVK